MAGWLAPIGAYAQPGQAAPGPRVAAGLTVISGGAFHGNNTPISAAKLRLRNVETGAVAGATVANDSGQFVFADMNPALYIIELISRDAKILAISDVVAVTRGASVATFVQEKGNRLTFRDLFFNAAGGIVSAAAATGATAVSPQAKRPVSPQK
jgi:hypothetical protein